MAWSTTKISKLAAARAQLDRAIELWFLDKDPISTHTLAAAAYQLLDDLNKHRATGQELLYDSIMIKDEYRKEWIQLIKKPVNFFKHANNDPEEIIEFAPESTLIFLMFGTMAINALGELSNDYDNTLITWLAIHKPTFVSKAFLERIQKGVPANDLHYLAAASKRELFETTLKARAELRAQGKI